MLLNKICILYSPDHLLLYSAPNLGPLISRWDINKFENCWYKSVRILEVLKLLFQQFLHLSRSQRFMRGPILGELSNNRWLGGNNFKYKIYWQCFNLRYTLYIYIVLYCSLESLMEYIQTIFYPVSKKHQRLCQESGRKTFSTFRRRRDRALSSGMDITIFLKPYIATRLEYVKLSRREYPTADVVPRRVCSGDVPCRKIQEA
jgi:hypothetical protein